MNMSVGGYNFTDSRISTILKSESLGEAQQMGLLDRVIDFFRGGVKREVIETAFKQITAADRDNVSNPEAKQLARFEALRAMSKPDTPASSTLTWCLINKREPGVTPSRSMARN